VCTVRACEYAGEACDLSDCTAMSRAKQQRQFDQHRNEVNRHLIDLKHSNVCSESMHHQRTDGAVRADDDDPAYR
jgi:chromosome condensin MukBEF ATPase and DNA-binding subunit MukB